MDKNRRNIVRQYLEKQKKVRKGSVQCVEHQINSIFRKMNRKAVGDKIVQNHFPVPKHIDFQIEKAC